MDSTDAQNSLAVPLGNRGSPGSWMAIAPVMRRLYLPAVEMLTLLDPRLAVTRMVIFAGLAMLTRINKGLRFRLVPHSERGIPQALVAPVPSAVTGHCRYPTCQPAVVSRICTRGCTCANATHTTDGTCRRSGIPPARRWSGH